MYFFVPYYEYCLWIVSQYVLIVLQVSDHLLPFCLLSVEVDPKEEFLKSGYYPVLTVLSAGHALHVFVNGQLAGMFHRFCLIILFYDIESIEQSRADSLFLCSYHQIILSKSFIFIKIHMDAGWFCAFLLKLGILAFKSLRFFFYLFLIGDLGQELPMEVWNFQNLHLVKV